MVIVGTGTVVLLVLVAHTGLSPGTNVNRALMVNFLALTLFGSLASAVTALETHFAGTAARQLRVWWTRGHLFLFWPLLVLLGFHILSVYYF